MGMFRLGFIANFLSHPVISGFITASGILIAASQVKYILGIKAEGETLPLLLSSLVANLGATNWPTVVIGAAATAFLFWVRKGLKPFLAARGMGARAADFAAKAGPVAAVAVSTLSVWGLGLEEAGVAVVGAVPRGLPPLTLPVFDGRVCGSASSARPR